ncbi:hypothetical protein QBC38DRAFT_254365 [Podospora fimiseda]|uniref:Uncharacterized protein n=1 Tax=Podospora fimiseda TaxID=252190 RepID=A0AAN7GW72_9PEZI|nr:hypothetical protein QBC38DRAFT_254365 [Podospora fimiseda]
MREGLKLCLHRGYVHVVLHIYNFIRQTSPRLLCNPIPVLEFLQQVFLDHVFSGRLPQDDFYQTFRAFLGGTIVAGRMSLGDRKTRMRFREPWHIEPEIKPQGLSDIYTMLAGGSTLESTQDMVTHRVRGTGDISHNRIQKSRQKVERLGPGDLLREAKNAA